MRLGGWLRLWVVLVVIYGVVVAGFTAMVMPTERELTASRAAQALQLLANVIKKSSDKKISAWDLRHYPLFKDKSDGEIAQSIVTIGKEIDLEDPKNKELAPLKEDILALEKSHQEKVAALPGRQLSAIGTALVIWIVPALALLALGYAIGWVRRGFKAEI